MDVRHCSCLRRGLPTGARQSGRRRGFSLDEVRVTSVAGLDDRSDHQAAASSRLSIYAEILCQPLATQPATRAEPPRAAGTTSATPPAASGDIQCCVIDRSSRCRRCPPALADPILDLSRRIRHVFPGSPVVGRKPISPSRPRPSAPDAHTPHAGGPAAGYYVPGGFPCARPCSSWRWLSARRQPRRPSPNGRPRSTMCCT